ncbi:hypothetical protein FOMG_19567 [Fusarium oxysporum f. sp. melonis 26406]|uniref:Uncharacterized protein n=1 Tax=Fusarium oxysporum f. sp. melonis 26406 TaxID=1089452 RepID=W9Z4Y4_FUSOX|nr:hypothetical protein FOMG_19567 [Fusarium oxysporum f. sp. melonis 26406]
MPESELPNPIATQAAGAIGISLSESRCSWTIVSLGILGHGKHKSTSP